MNIKKCLERVKAIQAALEYLQMNIWSLRVKNNDIEEKLTSNDIEEKLTINDIEKKLTSNGWIKQP